jgi:hypothetical protein
MATSSRTRSFAEASLYVVMIALAVAMVTAWLILPLCKLDGVSGAITMSILSFAHLPIVLLAFIVLVVVNASIVHVRRLAGAALASVVCVGVLWIPPGVAAIVPMIGPFVPLMVGVGCMTAGVGWMVLRLASTESSPRTRPQ